MPASPFTPAHQACREMLVETRKKTGMTQAQLAERLGRTQSFVAKYETGERLVDIVELVELAKALGFSPSGFVQRPQRRMTP